MRCPYKSSTGQTSRCRLFLQGEPACREPGSKGSPFHPEPTGRTAVATVLTSMRRIHKPRALCFLPFAMNSRFFFLVSCASLLLLAGCATPTHRARENAGAFRKLSPADQALVRHGRVRPGLSKEAVYIAWGSPDWHFEDGKGKQARETWIYERQLSTYAPLGSYDQVYASSVDLYAPRSGYGTAPGFGNGRFGNQGFLYPCARWSPICASNARISRTGNCAATRSNGADTLWISGWRRKRLPSTRR